MDTILSITSSHKIERTKELMTGLQPLVDKVVKEMDCTPYDQSPFLVDSKALVSLYIAGALLGQERGQIVRKKAIKTLTPPDRKIERQGKLPGKMFKMGDNHFREVSLTFDDGPGPYTDELLDVLKTHKVSATFFVIGCQISRFPDTIRRMLNEGHIIANHSWTHSRQPSLSSKVILTRLDWFDFHLQKVLGETYSCNYFRLPFNSGKNNARINSLYSARFREMVDWSIDPRDWDPACRKKVVDRILNDTRKKGAIILLHDNLKADYIPAKVDELITKLRDINFAFLNLDELLGYDRTTSIRKELTCAMNLAEEGKFREAYKSALMVAKNYPQAQEAEEALFLAEFFALHQPENELKSAEKVRKFINHKYPDSIFSGTMTE
jgi:peptidoglycan/xylan/chitin deacetylase (PgdA/CDA1 family)